MGKTIIINEDTQAKLSKEMEMNEYKFQGSIKRFLHDLLQDPVTAEPGNVLTLNGLSRKKLIKILVKKGILEKHMSIVDKNADGEPMTAKMKISFKVPKQDYKRKIKRLYIELFEKNVPPKKDVNESSFIFTPNEIDRLIGNNRGDQIEQSEKENFSIKYKDDLDSPIAYVDECCAGGCGAAGGSAGACGGGEGTGATSCSNDGAGQFMTPLFGVQRRTIYGTEPKKKKKKDVDEAATTSNNGDYQYTVPFPVDKDDPTMKRHKGVGGSESVNITEEEIRDIIRKVILTEGAESTKYGRHAIAFLVQQKDMSKENASKTLEAVMHDLEIQNTKDPKFMYILGATRLYTDSLSESTATKLKMILKYVASEGHQGDYNEDLNGEELGTLYERFRPIAAQDAERSRKAVSAKQYQNKGYNIVRIDTEEQAMAYGKYTSWCITHGSFDRYGLDDMKQCYFCLKNGFENVPEVVGENAPFDEYGLSMISVIVDENGEPTHITTRYNHDYNGENNPNLHTAEQVSDLIGVNFYETFKPNGRWQELLTSVKERLAAGEDPESIFEYAGPFSADGLAAVGLNDKYNFINTNGRIISDTWFDYVWDFNNGVTSVKLNDKFNYINTDGQLISDTWFDECGDFSEGFARVCLNGKYNFINTNGKLISKKWFDFCDLFFSDGFVIVGLNDKYNFISTNGTFLSKKWFDECGTFWEGFACVCLNDKYNFISTNGTFLSKKWFDECNMFREGFARVCLNGKYNFINTNGKLISKKWFDFCDVLFYNGFVDVCLNGEYHYMNTNGDIVK